MIIVETLIIAAGLAGIFVAVIKKLSECDHVWDDIQKDEENWENVPTEFYILQKCKLCGDYRKKKV
jgi:hypothetical protein